MIKFDDLPVYFTGAIKKKNKTITGRFWKMQTDIYFVEDNKINMQKVNAANIVYIQNSLSGKYNGGETLKESELKEGYSDGNIIY